MDFHLVSHLARQLLARLSCGVCPVVHTCGHGISEGGIVGSRYERFLVEIGVPPAH